MRIAGAGGWSERDASGCCVQSARPQDPLRVLIAEDEALIRLDLREMLEEEGFDVVGEAADGEQARRARHRAAARPGHL